MPARQGEGRALKDPARRGLLKAAGALGLSGLALAGCASRVAEPADSGAAAPSYSSKASILQCCAHSSLWFNSHIHT